MARKSPKDSARHHGHRHPLLLPTNAIEWRRRNPAFGYGCGILLIICWLILKIHLDKVLTLQK